MTRRRIIAVSLLLLGVVGVLIWTTSRRTEATDQDQIKLQLKWFDSGHSVGFYVASERGFYREEGLDVEIIPGGFNHPALPPVLSGDADIAVADADLVLIQRCQGKDLKVLATVFTTSLACYVSKPAAEVAAPTDLRGKIIGEFPGDITQNVMYALLNRHGVDQSDVELTQAGPFDAFLRDEIQVWPSYRSNEPLRMEARNEPVNVLYPEDWGVFFYSDALVTTAESVSTNRDKYVRFLRASRRGWDFAQSNPDVALDLMYEYLSEDREKSLYSREHAGRVIRKATEYLRDDGGRIFATDVERWRLMEQHLRDIGRIDGPSCVDELLDPSLVEDSRQ